MGAVVRELERCVELMSECRCSAAAPPGTQAGGGVKQGFPLPQQVRTSYGGKYASLPWRISPRAKQAARRRMRTYTCNILRRLAEYEGKWVVNVNIALLRRVSPDKVRADAAPRSRLPRAAAPGRCARAVAAALRPPCLSPRARGGAAAAGGRGVAAVERASVDVAPTFCRLTLCRRAAAAPPPRAGPARRRQV